MASLPITVRPLIEPILKSGRLDAAGFIVTAGLPEDRVVVLLIDHTPVIEDMARSFPLGGTR